jgi:hypothetical protein
MKIRCNNEKCKYEWDYQGDNIFYATCPRCLNKVKVRKIVLEDKKK